MRKTSQLSDLTGISLVTRVVGTTAAVDLAENASPVRGVESHKPAARRADSVPEAYLGK